MADEKVKKPKIDLKARIPTKTVKGLTAPGGPGAAIPPPPGAVPAPPPDLLARKSIPPRPTGDPNDPLGAAQGQPASSSQQIVVVGGDHEGGGTGGKKGVWIGLLVLSLVVGSGLGFVMGKNSAGNATKAQAQLDAKDLLDKVTKTDANLVKLSEALKTAQNDIEAKGAVEPATVESIKKYESAFSSTDFKKRELGYLGEENVGKLAAYAQKVGHVEALRAELMKNEGLSKIGDTLKNAQLDSKKFKYGITLAKPGNGKDDPKVTMAMIVDFGDPLDLKTALTGFEEKKPEEPKPGPGVKPPPPKDDKAPPAATPKLKTKAKEFDVWPGGEKPPEFLSKEYISLIDTREWKSKCNMYPIAKESALKPLKDLSIALDGEGDDQGTIKPGKELIDKLKSLAK